MLESIFYKKNRIRDLHKDGIVSIETLNENAVFSCNDDTILLYNFNTDTKQLLYSGRKSKIPDELGCLKSFSIDSKSSENNYLFASNNDVLQLFDLTTFKQINKYKFSKETVNSIEVNKSGNSIICCDDLGEIKVLDVRIKSAKTKTSLSLPTITLKKSYTGHSNICSMVKFNPLNEYEIFSSSFDCSILKWDLRSVKKTSNNDQYMNRIDVNETLAKINQNKENDGLLVSTMTPNFVHSIYATEMNNNLLVICGLENGLSIVFDAESCNYVTHEQLQTFNCALTQLTKFNLTDRMKSSVESLDESQIMVGGGNGKTIEFFDISTKKNSIKKFESFKINHEEKVNCLKCINNKMFVADTTDDLIVYDFY